MQQTPGSAEVVADVYSGRPNPSWQLSGADFTALLRLLDLAEEANTASEDVGGLGFRGFEVKFVTAGAPRRLYVNGQSVSDGARRLFDRSRSIEQLLVATMPANVRRDLADVLPR
ncbi:hypothetical protein IP86_03375 [Rhodopseudomonas sp. AAP120]|uniref:hypothetical protein n=1 Tax=Rhodopseudomonas sp. AAP120 TaxID=1523430 RepID=UPI0006B8A411|nr:hypothetical protein [Rhodopseudomonas sp. AAP120]KPG01612.1 hypothetical protein IP86_03375 [Rhodopseudomonas sp. AAP120]